MPLQSHEVQSFNHHSVPPPTSENPSSSYDEKDLSPSTKSENPNWDLVNNTRKAPRVPRETVQLMKSLLLPLVAITYLSFCYIVHTRMVPLTVHNLTGKTSTTEIASIKSGITSISIFIIAIGLWPLSDLVAHIKSEEFFRALHTHGSGVPLSTINGISIPSSGMSDTILAIIRRRCSPYLVVAFFAGLLAMAASTLSPAILTVESILIDTDMMAFRVGSVPADSVYNVTDIVPFKTSALYANSEFSALIAWAETSLGVRYSFTQKGGEEYIVPPLVDLDLGVSARWLTDVAALHPTCVWSKANVSGTLDFRPSNITSTFTNQTKSIFLSDVGVDLKVSPSYSAYTSPTIHMLDAEFGLSNHTNRGRLSDGTIGWEIGQCISGCRGNSPDFQTVVTYNFTGIPTIQIVGADMTWEVAYLMCSPHLTIETREARSDSQGILAVYGDKRYTKQGNLHPGQMGILLSYAMSGFADKSGPSLPVGGMGSKAQAALIFGNNQINSINTTKGEFTITPMQNQTITDSYVRLLQSITNSYMGGKLGTAYVPGRLSKPALVFRSSMDYLAASTALFAVLTLIILWAHFRAGKGEQFTLARIATVLDQSDISSRFGMMKRDEDESRGLSKADWEEKFIHEYGERKVTLNKSDGSLRFLTQDAGRAF